MLFNSIHFLIFFPIVLVLYWSLSHNDRWKLLLIASAYFYACFDVSYLFLLGASIGISYYTANKIHQSENDRKRKLWMWAGVLGNVALLFVFKYLGFTFDSINALLANFNVVNQLPELKLLLPIGISFYTFQVLSYTMDVYYGMKEPEKSFGIYALYVSFFPQLVAGPIERSTRLLPQLHQEKKFDYNGAIEGFKQVIWGFFKKMVIADRLAIYVNEVYASPSDFEGLQVALATLFFTFQIYCDFSAYSDIAIGTARMMGFDLMENFKRPFISKSLTEFWQRWHISLYSWFTQYIYTPIAMKRRDWGVFGTVYAIAIVFLFTGVWHGAKWTFIIWGCLHGAVVILEQVSKKTRKKIQATLPRFIFNTSSLLLTFGFVVLVGVFFRAENVTDAIQIWETFFSFNIDFGAKLNIGEFGMVSIAIGFLMVAVMLGVEYLESRKKYWYGTSFTANAIYAIAILFMVMAFGVFEPQEFIYFQF